MQIRVNAVGPALHPGESVVSINTRDGEEKLAVDNLSIVNNWLEVGWPVGSSSSHQIDKYYLVELPRETFRGFWRVWVHNSDLQDSAEQVRAYG